jgi:hypothetical protein
MGAVRRRSASTALLCLAALVAVGCATTPKNLLYSGDALPQEKVAVVIAPASELFEPQPLIRRIDSREIERSDNGSAYAELLPGLHVISIGVVQGRFLEPSRFSLSDRVIRLQAEAGHTYEVKILTKGGWDPEIIDKGIGPTPSPKAAPPQ